MTTVEHNQIGCVITLVDGFLPSRKELESKTPEKESPEQLDEYKSRDQMFLESLKHRMDKARRSRNHGSIGRTDIYLADINNADKLGGASPSLYLKSLSLTDNRLDYRLIILVTTEVNHQSITKKFKKALTDLNFTARNDTSYENLETLVDFLHHIAGNMALEYLWLLPKAKKEIEKLGFSVHTVPILSHPNSLKSKE